MDYPNFIISNQKEEYISIQRVLQFIYLWQRWVNPDFHRPLYVLYPYAPHILLEVLRYVCSMQCNMADAKQHKPEKITSNASSTKEPISTWTILITANPTFKTVYSYKKPPTRNAQVSFFVLFKGAS